ncbi:hypothetical protein AOQ84DRAFT_407111 [Glonium stellatum]|uniref:Uncharacterized protein n=1 Tax=Glonium stellatum TaxID=574774 RepID=A0A8E2JT17_9PEZI|nr:hypothetical protein AOQ84DRAFT_407111 [Glonium stellatum]
MGFEWLNPLAPYILRLVLSTIETTFILFFVHKLRQARHLTEERVKECKENDCTHPFLSANEVVLLLLIATELPTFISSIVCLIVCLFNNGQDNLILLDLIVLEICLFLSSLGAARWSHPVALILSQSSKRIKSRSNPTAPAEKLTPNPSLECIIIFVRVLTRVASQSRPPEGSEPAQWRAFWDNVEMGMDQELTGYTGNPLDDFRCLLSCSGYDVNWTRDEVIPFQCWVYLDGVKEALLGKYHASDRKVPYTILDERGWESFSNLMQTSGS